MGAAIKGWKNQAKFKQLKKSNLRGQREALEAVVNLRNTAQ